MLMCSCSPALSLSHSPAVVVAFDLLCCTFVCCFFHSFFLATCALIDSAVSFSLSISVAGFNFELISGATTAVPLHLSAVSQYVIKNIYSALAERKVVNFLAQLMLACSATSVSSSLSLSLTPSLCYCPFDTGLTIRSSHFALMAKTKHLAHICERVICDQLGFLIHFSSPPLSTLLTPLSRAARTK